MNWRKLFKKSVSGERKSMKLEKKDTGKGESRKNISDSSENEKVWRKNQVRIKRKENPEQERNERTRRSLVEAKQEKWDKHRS